MGLSQERIHVELADFTAGDLIEGYLQFSANVVVVYVAIIVFSRLGLNVLRSIGHFSIYDDHG
jgi:hypothetical protein